MSDICRECGDDDGPYSGLCLDCLEMYEMNGWDVTA